MLARIFLIIFTILCVGNMAICTFGFLTFSELGIRLVCGSLSVIGVLLGTGIHYLYFEKTIFSLGWAILGCILVIAISSLQIYSLKKRKMNYLNSHSIRDLFHHLNVGLAYSMAGSGEMVLCNALMQEVGETLLGHKPRRGEELIQYNQSDIKIGGSIYHFAVRQIFIRDYPLIEICAFDLSKQQELMQNLREENQKLRKMNENLRNYLSLIEELTKEKEILRTKEIIHANFGKLLLSTNRAIEQKSGQAEVSRILRGWKNTLSLLEIDTDEDKADLYQELLETAQNVGVTIHIEGVPVEENSTDREVFLTALQECLTNTVEHADGHNMYVKLGRNNHGRYMLISNDGKIPVPGSKEGGGLSNLRQKVESTGGYLEIGYEPNFSIRITKPHV